MTRSQIPAGVTEVSPFGTAPQASYGYGWFVAGEQRWPINGALLPIGTYLHSGFGGHALWVDPLNDIVGMFCSVAIWDEGIEAVPGNPKKLEPAAFEDMVTAAVVDGR